MNQEIVENIINDYYNRVPIKTIYKTYRINNKYFKEILEKYHFVTRKEPHAKKYSCNEDYFEKIDTQNKAYILGFIMADGCVLDKNIVSMYLRISLQERDGYILESFKKELESDSPILLFKNQNKNQQDKSLLTINSHKL